MENDNKSGAIMRRRLRRAAGQLVEDSSLRDHLTDEQAQLLIDWGLKLVEQTAERTASLPDEDAAPVLEEKVTAVRTIMQLVNRMMAPLAGDSSSPAEDKIDEQMTRLLKNLAWLSGEATRLGHLRQVEKFNQIRSRPEPVPDEAFEQLMQLIQIENKAGEEEE